jgi:amidohydrolase
MTTATEWTEQIDRRREDLIALRRDFHRHPELSFEERRTAEIIAGRLSAAKLEVRTGIAKTGVVGILRGDRPGRTIAWRADIDALPLVERLEAPFSSGTPGVMHACGHDGHAAVGIELAEILAARRAEMPGTAVFIFQPAEEIIGGAKPMIEAGVLDDPRVDEIYGLHFTTTLPAGRMRARPGPTLASCDYFSVRVRGQGGHGAMPHLSVDPMMAAANILLGMQTLVAREVPAQETAVMTVGQLMSGTKGNIIPDTAEMRGTLRAYTEQVREQLKSRLGAYAEHVARAYRAEAEVRWEGGSCPACVNHEAETSLVRQCAVSALGEAAVEVGERSMPSDDMALFLAARPGCYFQVGIRPADGRPHPHHAPEFEMNEDGLEVGLRVALAVMRRALAPAAVVAR